MGLIEIIKSRKSEEYESYKKAKKENKEEGKRIYDYYIQAKNKYDSLIKDGYSDEKVINYCKSEAQRWYYEYKMNELASKFIRPNNQQEIEDRNRIASTFGNALLSIVGEDSNLRFHGTPIYLAEQIIKSGEISSTSDRYDGYIRSTDISGYCSASSIKSINRTINYFTDFASYQRSLPCGVLFVLREKEGDFELRESDEMQNVNFYQNPNQLVAIVCTNEVIDMVNKWCIDSNVDTNKVFSYDSFLEYAKNNNLEAGKNM